MSQHQLDQLIEAAAGRGILQADATAHNITRPWPIVLMTGLGAWLAAIPFAALLFMVFGSQLNKGALCYVLGVVLLGGALLVLRGAGKSAFVEQLGLPLLLVAGILLGMGFYRDLSLTLAGVMLMLLITATTWAVPQTWLRALLGAAACAAFIATIANQRNFDAMMLWRGVHCALLVWIAAVVWLEVRPVSGANADRAIALESAASGWAALLLTGLAYTSGQTFLIGAVAEPLFSIGLGNAITANPWPRVLSLMLAGGALAWLARCWPAFRAPRIVLAAILLAALSWVLPLLGGALLMLALCATSGRWLLAAAAGVSAAWIVGSFYYQLEVPLARKALIMVGIGALLGVMALWNWPRRQPVSGSTPTPFPWPMTLSLVAILAVVNVGIWQKENLIRHGRAVFIELAPADPRSLMQGDYMRLNFRRSEMRGVEPRSSVIAKINERGIAVIDRAAGGAAPAPDEIIIALPLSDAWYFKEGEALRWEKARYGEFRIDSNGRALLVNLRGADLEKL